MPVATSVADMTASITRLALGATDLTAMKSFVAALGVEPRVEVRPTAEASDGFRGFTISLIVGQPSTVDGLVDAALGAGAKPLKPVSKSFWGYGGVVQAPDGSIWKVATSSKKDKGLATLSIDDVVLLIGSADVKAAKRFYVSHGFEVAKSFGSKYVEFAGGPVKLALYGHQALAKDAGVPAAGSGSHRLSIVSEAGEFTDPDGFAWTLPEAVS